MTSTLAARAAGSVDAITATVSNAIAEAAAGKMPGIDRDKCKSRRFTELPQHKTNISEHKFLKSFGSQSDDGIDTSGAMRRQPAGDQSD